ncbi:MAG: single-stranded-DNA-specific exonuclease RecJ [Ruminococcus flavefaciens]|nr:single-stranded-DNA-specific exonuclease RecJ [Ruminococcus flavefaciens]
MKKWVAQNPDSSIVHEIMSKCGVSQLTATVLASQGYSSPEEVIDKLGAKELSDPFLIKDMKEAVDVITTAVDNNDRICIYGDYDCDGIMSTVIMYSYLSEIGADVMYYIPERSEGYGLNNNAIDEIFSAGAKLILTVDNGISAINEAEYIYSLGMKLVITDHHQQGETLPRAEAIVDPHRHDCNSPFKYMCGAGIALKLVSAIEGGDYTVALEQFGDLATIATVADIVSLTGENRSLVSYGMKLIDNTDRPSLIALKEVCKIKKAIDTSAIGFRLAPRINASGRFGSPRMATKLFLSEVYDEALYLAEDLDELNEERKSAESGVISDIYKMIDENPPIIRERVIFICGKNWHHGVIGIVASRIQERFGKPCFIASENDGEIRGSARAFGDFSVFSALTYASETLEKFGGHMGAGGFTIKEGMKDDFHALIEKYALENHKYMPLLTIKADAILSPEMISVESIDNLKILEPYGCENEKPRFLICNARVNEIISLSDGKHSKLRIETGGLRVEALAFFMSPSSLMVKSGDICDMIVTLGINEYNGNKNVNLFIEDIRPKRFEQSKYFSAKNAFEMFMRGEELPANYYRSMLPTRDDTVKIYKNILEAGISSDQLYMKFCPEINYCKFSVAVEALRQLGLVTVSSETSVIKRVKTDKKSDLDSAPVFISLRKKLN